jgi:hypothetical protein
MSADFCKVIKKRANPYIKQQQGKIGESGLPTAMECDSRPTQAL